MTLCEEHACATIMRDRRPRSFVLPRYTPMNWFECDVFELTKSGYFREYEVKMTLADFRNDAKKMRTRYPRPWGTPPVQENKHELLKCAYEHGPSEFWYVTPPRLIPREELPFFAGLIELQDLGDGRRPSYRWMPVTVVTAPRLHRVKLDPKVHEHAIGVCYYRLHAAMECLRDRTAPPTAWQDQPPPAVEESVA